jgi:hypothetical protein
MIYVLAAAVALQAALSGYTCYMNSKDRASLLNAVMAKSTQEFVQLQRVPRKKTKRPEVVQDDAGIAYGL